MWVLPCGPACVGPGQPHTTRQPSPAPGSFYGFRLSRKAQQEPGLPWEATLDVRRMGRQRPAPSASSGLCLMSPLRENKGWDSVGAQLVPAMSDSQWSSYNLSGVVTLEGKSGMSLPCLGHSVAPQCSPTGVQRPKQALSLCPQLDGTSKVALSHL